MLNSIYVCLQQLVPLVQSSVLGEQALISIGYAAMAPLFNGSTLSPKWVDANSIVALQQVSERLLVSIFESHPVQRTWLLEEVLTSLIKMPSDQRTQRKYRVTGSRPIHTVSAMILRLIQSSASHQDQDARREEHGKGPGPPENNSDDQGQVPKDPELPIESVVHDARVVLDSVMSPASFIVRFLIARTIKREAKVSSLESEYRALLEALVDDTTSLLNLPEWPVAEIVLRTYTSQLVDLIEDPKIDVAIKGTAVDHLGLIATKLASVATSLSTPTDLCNDSDMGGDDASEGGQQQEEQFEDYSPMPKLHGEIPLAELQKLSCLVTQYLQHLRGSSSKDASERHALRLFAANMLMALAPALKSAYQEQSATAVLTNAKYNQDDGDGGDVEGDGSCETERQKIAHKLSQLLQDTLNEKWPNEDPSIVTVQDNILPWNRLMSISECLSTVLALHQSFDTIIGHIVYALGMSTVALRSRALKALGNVIVHDPSILGRVNVKFAINHRLQDSSPMVREAAIDLIGKHAVTRPDLIEQYYDYLCVRVLDRGAAVRKRVMRILREVYLRSKDMGRLVDISRRILLRTGDEERRVKEMATRILQELWLSNVPGVPRLSASGGSEFAQLKAFSSFPCSAQRELAKRVGVMANVAGHATAPQENHLVLMEAFFKQAWDNRAKPEAGIHAHMFPAIISAAFEQLLRAEEAQQPPGDRDTQILALMHLIDVLSAVWPEWVGQYIEMLTVYLKANVPQDEVSIVILILTILGRTIPHVPRQSPKFIREVETELIKMLSSSPQSVLAKAIPCLCAIVEGLSLSHAKLVRVLASCSGKYIFEDLGALLRCGTTQDNALTLVINTPHTCA
ncbi:Sister chromatid cohesion protein 2, partial [Spiromyces aspiralis]